jgi:hypothetical protein
VSAEAAIPEPAVVITSVLAGERSVYVGPDIPDAAHPVVREGAARRRLVGTTGKCPCGAVLPVPNRVQRRAAMRSSTPMIVRVQHEDECPAIDPATVAWAGGRA